MVCWLLAMALVLHRNDPMHSSNCITSTHSQLIQTHSRTHYSHTHATFTLTLTQPFSLDSPSSHSSASQRFAIFYSFLVFPSCAFFFFFLVAFGNSVCIPRKRGGAVFAFLFLELEYKYLDHFPFFFFFFPPSLPTPSSSTLYNPNQLIHHDPLH